MPIGASSREIAIRGRTDDRDASARSIGATESERDGGLTRTSRVSTRVRGPRVGLRARTALCPRTDRARHLYDIFLHVQEKRAQLDSPTTDDCHAFLLVVYWRLSKLLLPSARDLFLYARRVPSTHRVMFASLNTGGRGEPTARLVYRC